MYDINACPPQEILNKLAVIFESARVTGDLPKLRDGLALSERVDTDRFDDSEKQ